MPKQVFHTDMVLYPSKEKSYLEEALSLVENLRGEYPEFEKLRWSLTLATRKNGTARVEITVTDLDAPDHRETVKVFIAIIIFTLILFGLTYL